MLFEEGDEGDSMYIVVAGVLGVRASQADGTEVMIDQLAPGAIVGELALLSGQKRSATVYAVNDTGLICLGRSEFEELSADEQNKLVDMETKVPERWQRLQLTKALGNFFGELDANSLQILQNQLEWQHLSHGDVLIRQGEATDGLYLLVNGRLRVTFTSPEGENEVIGEIGPGESVGEFSLLTDDLRSADVHAVRETNVVKMTPPVFDRLARENPDLMRKITRIIVERQQRELKRQKPSTPEKLNLALLPASPTVDTRLFAREFVPVLARYGSALVLDSQHFDELYGQPGASRVKPDDPSNPAMVSWMDELEADHEYLLFVADYEMSVWTQRCIGQADRVLIIADPREDPMPSEVEQMLAQSEVPVRTELVLWHPAETERPQGTSAWLDTHDVFTHHHVRQNDAAHMERLARRLTGNAVALVLSGGAARGFAHMGVHQAMEELGIPIDYVGASSMGAVVGASIVTIESNSKMMTLSKRFANPKDLFDRKKYPRQTRQAL